MKFWCIVNLMMTPEQTIKALDRYLAFYAEGAVDSCVSLRFPSGKRGPDQKAAIQHVLWMCHEAEVCYTEP
jgi:hypothetical protein